MPRTYSAGILKPLERVVIFIDGGYVRGLFSNLFRDDNVNYANVNYANVRNDLLNWYNALPANPFRANLIRIYYYDGITDDKEDAQAHAKQREYFESLMDRHSFLSVELGEAVKTKGTFRQKGVDVLLTIDSLSMAYLDIYASGLFLLGDRDFIPLINTIKGTGKKTFGIYYKENVSRELVRSFDFSLVLDEKMMKNWCAKEQSKA